MVKRMKPRQGNKRRIQKSKRQSVESRSIQPTQRRRERNARSALHLSTNLTSSKTVHTTTKREKERT